MYEHKCGRLLCPQCIALQTFVALVLSPLDHRNLHGGKVSHITDASCRSCGYVFGRMSVRDEVTGNVRHNQPIVSDAEALRAARALGLPPQAALYARVDEVLAEEARAAKLESSAVAKVIAKLMAPPDAPVVHAIADDPDEDAEDDSLAAFLEQHGAATR